MDVSKSMIFLFYKLTQSIGSLDFKKLRSLSIEWKERLDRAIVILKLTASKIKENYCFVRSIRFLSI